HSNRRSKPRSYSRRCLETFDPMWRAAVLVIVLVTASCTSGGRGRDSIDIPREIPTTTEPTLPETVVVPTTAPIRTPADYLSYALDVIEDNAYYWRRVDWPVMRAEASRRAVGAANF